MKIRKNNTKKNSIRNRIIGVAVSIALIITNVPIWPFSLIVNTETIVHAVTYPDYPDTMYDATSKTATINTVNDLILYSQAYFSHSADHKGDTIDIGISGGGIAGVELDGFIPIGTSSNPFEGTLKIAGDMDQAFCLKESFFDHLSDKATITGGASGELLIARTVNNGGDPILAKHVHGDNTEATKTWKIKICPYVKKDDNNQDETNINSNAGIIGELLDGAKIILEVNDINVDGSDYGAIYANSGDAGYFCGKLGKNASLTIQAISGTNTGYSITSTAGNAGGVVGAMDEGSTLTLNVAMPSSATPTITTNADKKYAGGLVGRNEGGSIVLGDSYSSTAYPVKGTVAGKGGSGGLFGYYRPVFTESSSTAGLFEYDYDIDIYDISVTVNGSGSVGGLFGVLENQQLDSITTSGNTETRTYKAGGNITIKRTSGTSYDLTHTSGDSDNFGGLIGHYSSFSSESILKIDGVSVSPEKSGGTYKNFGGIIGDIKDNNAAYILFDGCTVDASGVDGGNFGGLVGAADNAFVDVLGTTTITAAGYKGGGIVGSFEDGVLRLAGTTDLGNTSCAEGGQIVNKRDSALIYAENGWDLTRSASVTTFDDIGSWGEVLRFSKLTKASVLSDNAASHMITLVSPSTTISDVNIFARDAICFSIEVGANGNPWLEYASGSTVLDANSNSTALTLSADISLAETGLTGLTRDNGSARTIYKGSLDGGDHTITLAIGDTSAPSGVADFNGMIYRHTLNGLFGQLDGARITNLTLAGTVNVDACANMYVGSVAAQSSGDLTVTDVSVTAVFKADGSSAVTLGRLVGQSSGTFTLTNTNKTDTNHAGIDYGIYSGNITSGNSAGSTCLGGVFGKLTATSTSNKGWNISDIALSGVIKNTSSKSAQQIGGLIACITDDTDTEKTSGFTRELNISSISADDLTVDGSATSSSGGLLGYAWYDTNVNVNGVTIGETTGCNLKLTGSADLGGMVYCATGKWEIPEEGLTLSGLTITAASAKSFGMIINKGWKHSDTDNDFFSSPKDSAIYLLLSDANAYDCSDVTISGLKTGIVFDELVAYSAYYREENGTKHSTDASGDPYILQNGNGIVSIKATLNMSGSGESNTYKPQIAQDSNGTAYQNKWTRYYYNLDTLDADTAQGKLMLWGLNQYAHKSLSSFFVNPFSGDVFADEKNEESATGFYDMTGYSWYPVDVTSKSITVKGVFKFANNEFEICEAENNVNVSDSSKPSTSKSSLNQTQHYMMHEGLFRNVKYSAISLIDTKWQGSISQLTDGYGTSNAEKGTGVLVFGKMTGKDDGHSVVNSSKGKIVLDGIHVCNATLTEAGGDYAPLLINKVDSYCDLTIYNVSVNETSTNTSWYKENISSYSYAASSLIGNVGLSTTSNNLRVNFTKIKLDGRKSSTSLDTATNEDLDSIYLTTHSIFSRASLLNQFQYASGSDGAYTFAYTDDWTDTENMHEHKGEVTYGSEISGHPLVDSIISKDQYYGKEFWYRGEEPRYYVKYSGAKETGTGKNSNDEFEAPVSYVDFRPYVYDTDKNENLATNYKHQLKVNHASAALEGCGTYNDPYKISTGDQLKSIANIINGGGDGSNIILPNVSSTATTVNAPTLLSLKWDNNGHSSFTESGGYFYLNADSTSASNYSKEVVRKYLAGAYYVLSDNIELDNEYPGLGATGDNYGLFRGVINGDSKTITNKSAHPLIAASNGSVIRELTIYADCESITAEKKNEYKMDPYISSQSGEAYGAVIGLVFGGDNIIDNVKVSFGDNTATTEVECGKITVSGDGAYLAPVGGYIGVVVNGAVIFKNMTRGNALISGLGDSTVFESDGTTAITMDSTKFLYVNPIIGRVLNGYAVTETPSSYRPFETGIRTYVDGSKAFCRTVNGVTDVTYLDKSVSNFASLNTSYTEQAEPVTMRNGTKNYSIPDISASDTEKLSVGAFTTSTGNYKKATVKLLDAQALFLFSALIQSNATKNNSTALADNSEASGSYGATNFKTTHVADYDEVGQGEVGTTAPTSGDLDYLVAITDGYSGSGVRPYIVHKYGYVDTTYQDGIFRVTNSNSILNIQLGADNATATTFYLPDGFKGLGSYLNDNCISLFEFNGQNNEISMDSKIQYYRQKIVYDIEADTGRSNTAIDNYLPALYGFGFFNCLRQNRKNTGFNDTNTQTLDAYRIHDFILSGNIKAQVFQSNGEISGYDFGRDQKDIFLQIVNVGGLCGLAGNGQNDKICINKVHLNNLSVFGAKTAGGLIGYINTNGTNQYVYECDADKLKVEAGQEAGGIVGVVAGTNFNLDGRVSSDKNVVVKLISVGILSNLTGGDGKDSDKADDEKKGFNTKKNRAFYAGGVIGRSKVQITINDIDVGVLNSKYSGFIGNTDRSNDTLNELSNNGTEYKGYSIYNGSPRYYNSADKPWSIVGGVIGAVSTSDKSLTVTNCNVYNISMYGGFSGGIAGRPEGTATIFNCTVSSTQTADQMETKESTTGQSSYMLTGWYSIGGLTGEARKANTIDGCTVSNYVLRCYSEDNDRNRVMVGGLVGRSKGGAASIYNSSVVNCYIEGRGKSTGDNDRLEGIGGIAGLNDDAVNGYNILIKDIKLLANNTSVMDRSSSTPFAYSEINTSDNKLQNGYVCGASTAGKILKIVGFSLQITDSTNTTITDPWYSTAKPDEANSFFIRADYNCACDTNSKRSKTFSGLLYRGSGYIDNVKDFTSTASTKPDITDNHPYVTSSPLRNISPSQFLTGDAIAELKYEDSLASKIVIDAMGDKPTGYYQDIRLAFTSFDKTQKVGTLLLEGKPAANDANLEKYKAKFPELFLDGNGVEITNASDYPTYGDMYLSELNSKFSTFKTMAKNSSLNKEYDFPVLILDDSNAYVTTELINNYLRILTNTTYDFADTSSGKYVVKFGKCTYNTTTGLFDVNWTNANLKITSEGYFDITDEYDNMVENGQFTLIDVQFKTPAQIGNKDYIAYHLYVPVFVNKMLKYDFECSTLSGTTYLISSYVNAPRNNMLLENLETPVTVQFSWIYYRTLEEWVKQIESGESLLNSFDKKIEVENVGANAFPYANMVLIDANNHNKPYYASHLSGANGVADAYDSNNKLINLSEFTTDGLEKTNASSNSKFSPLEFNDYFTITSSNVELTGDDVVKCVSLGTSSNGGTIRIGEYYYRPYRDETDSSLTPVWLRFAYKPDMTVYKGGNCYISENYYISFFTEASNLIYHVIFSSQQSFDNDSNVPTDRNSTGNGSTHLFLGEIYENNFSFVTSSMESSKAINVGSTSINAEFKADLRIANSSKDIVARYINTPTVRVYQSFLVNYQNDSLGIDGAIHSERGIKTPANVTINSYVVDSENITNVGVGGKSIKEAVLVDPNCEISVANGTITNNYIELRNNTDLKEYLKKAYDVNSSNIPFITVRVNFTLDYVGENDTETQNNITKQFPLRDESASRNEGVELEDIGSRIIGASNISPSNTGTAYSRTTDEDIYNARYYTDLNAGATLYYDSNNSTDNNGLFAQLGINSWKSPDSYQAMNTLITYVVKNIDQADTATGMVLTLKLYRKGEYEVSGKELPIDEYITDLAVVKKTGNATRTNSAVDVYEYNISLPKTSLVYDEDNMIYKIPVNFSVYTGANDNFELAKDENDDPYKRYSNYMIRAEIYLYNANGQIIGSQAHDHIIYTNAKIHSDWINGN